MSSNHISSGEASKPKHNWNSTTNRSKPMTTKPEDNNNQHMLKISLNSITKLEVRNLKRKLTSELDDVRALIKRFNPISTVKKPKPGSKKGPPGTAQIFKNCNNLLTRLMKHKFGWVFNIPVDAKGLGLHDYHTIVKQPMDLGTVKAKLGKNLYSSPLDFADDVRLTFNNAILYNPIGHEVHQYAGVLLNMFKEKWVSIEMQYDNLHRKFKPTRDIEFPGPITAPSPVVVEPLRAPTPPPPPPVVEDKPKLVEEVPVVNRELTLEEKRSLSEDLQDLPFDKLETVVQIIRKRNPDVSQQDDEIELDIESIDIDTLWELYRVVSGYKESLSKKKEVRDAESVHNIVQEPNNLVTGTETSRVNESGPGKAIRKSSPTRQGSSSSNSSSSCSSDSDSDSSSGHGSDTGN